MSEPVKTASEVLSGLKDQLIEKRALLEAARDVLDGTIEAIQEAENTIEAARVELTITTLSEPAPASIATARPGFPAYVPADEKSRVRPQTMHFIREVIRAFILVKEDAAPAEDEFKTRVRRACSLMLGQEVAHLSELHWKDARTIITALRERAGRQKIQLPGDSWEQTRGVA